MVFKGIDGIKPVSYPKIRNLTDLWLLDAVENEKDPSVLTLTYSPVKTFKSGMVNNWGLYFIDTVIITFQVREHSGSVVECLTRDRGAAGSSLTGVTALWSFSKTHLS